MKNTYLLYFDFDVKHAKKMGYSNVYVLCDNFMKRQGLSKLHRGVNYITSSHSPVEITLILQKLYTQYDKLKRCVNECKLLRINEMMDMNIVEGLDNFNDCCLVESYQTS